MVAETGIDIAGLVTILLLYLVILAVGIIASYKFRRKYQEEPITQEEMNLVAGRKITGLVGVFTMTATTVGGGYINGTAESVATQGLVWTLSPFGIFIGLIIGGLFYAKKMREKKYVTMLDPFQEKYNNGVIGMLYLAAVCGDIFWSASLLAALGTSLSVIIGIDVVVSVLVSAAIAVMYTVFGQMISVAYTDIVQLLFVIIGLVISVPFALHNEASESLLTTASQWTGRVEQGHIGLWLDLAIAMTLGSIPWQPYFQRVLSVRTVRQAQVLSIVGAFGALFLAVPPVLIGAISATADWNRTDLGVSPVQTGDASLTLPFVMKYLTPRPVAIIGLGAVSAAVMSSMDSAIMSSASLFTHNVYKMVIRKKASQTELAWAQRVSLVVLGSVAAALALLVKSVYGMFILAADIVFVVLLPQLTSVLYCEASNSYGAIVGYLCGVLLRLGAGEAYISLPTLIKFPLYDSERDIQLFPFRTFSAAVSFIAIISVSILTQYLFSSGLLKEKFDVLKCFQIERQPQEGAKPVSDVLPSSSTQLLEEKISSCHCDSYINVSNGILKRPQSLVLDVNKDCSQF